MLRKTAIGLFVLAALAGGAWLIRMTEDVPGQRGEVTVYAAVDPAVAQPLFDDYTRVTGVRVVPLYANQPSAAAGLVNRLDAERARPRCDVLWSDDPVQTARAAARGALAPFRPIATRDFPRELSGPGGRWVGFDLQPRVIVYNTERVPAGERPRSLAALAETAGRRPAWLSDPVGLARPSEGGRPLLWLAALWCEDRAAAGRRPGVSNAEALRTLRAAPGLRGYRDDMAVAEAVGRGEIAVGFSDAASAFAAAAAGMPVDVLACVSLGGGTVATPDTLSLVAKGPRPNEGKTLIEYLLSRPVREMLRGGPTRSAHRVAFFGALAPISVADWPYIADHWDEAGAWAATLVP